ncbi:transglycosylase SLT domain-containing protein [Candidatus Margulisiibacteriota bacterium]
MSVQGVSETKHLKLNDATARLYGFVYQLFSKNNEFSRDELWEKILKQTDIVIKNNGSQYVAQLLKVEREKFDDPFISREDKENYNKLIEKLPYIWAQKCTPIYVKPLSREEKLLSELDTISKKRMKAIRKKIYGAEYPEREKQRLERIKNEITITPIESAEPANNRNDHKTADKPFTEMTLEEIYPRQDTKSAETDIGDWVSKLETLAERGAEYFSDTILPEAILVLRWLKEICSDSEKETNQQISQAAPQAAVKPPVKETNPSDYPTTSPELRDRVLGSPDAEIQETEPEIHAEEEAIDWIEPAGVPVPDPEKDKYRTYTVKKGDNLYAIAKKYSGSTLESLALLNNIPYPYIIEPEQKIFIPVVTEKWVRQTVQEIKDSQENGRLNYMPVELILAMIRKESDFNPFEISWCDAFGLLQFIDGTGEEYGAKVLEIDNEIIYMRRNGEPVVIIHEDDYRYGTDMKINGKPATIIGKDDYSYDTEMLFDPRFCIRLAMEYLHYLINRHNGKIIPALAEYNGGKKGVKAVQQFLLTGVLPTPNIEEIQWGGKKKKVDNSFRQTIKYVYCVMRFIKEYDPSGTARISRIAGSEMLRFEKHKNRSGVADLLGIEKK